MNGENAYRIEREIADAAPLGTLHGQPALFVAPEFFPLPMTKVVQPALGAQIAESKSGEEINQN